MENTEEYQIRTSDTSVLKEKRKIFENPKNEDMKEFFERCKKDFFPDKSNMTPMQLLDNSLTQCYNLKVNQCAFKYDVEGAIATYRDLRWLAEADGYNLINDTKEIIEVEKENEKQD